MGLTYRQMFHSDYLAAADLDGKDVTLTVADLDRTSLTRDDETKQAVWTLLFKEKRRDGSQARLVLNNTNAQLIFAMWPDTDQWMGKQIVLSPERDNSPINETGWCIRVTGSPDIEKSIEATVSLPRKKPAKRKLTKTKVDKSQPAFDAETGEVADDRTMDEKYGETMPDFEQGGFNDLGES